MNGIVLIFDEICTGIRLAEGGAQEYFKVVQIYLCLVRELVTGTQFQPLEDYVTQLWFFSGTFGGEALSLAALKAF